MSVELQIFVCIFEGGSLIQSFIAIFDRINFDWQKVKFFFCDERKVDFNNADSTFGEYKRNFLSKVSPKITENQFVVIEPNLSGKILVTFICKDSPI